MLRVFGSSMKDLLNPGFLLKKIVCFIYLLFARRRNRCQFNDHDFNSRDPRKTGIVLLQHEWDAELPLKDLKQESESIFLYGTRSSGECLLVQMTRGCRQAAHAWLYLRLANGMTYTLPDRVSLDLSEGNRFHTNGLRLQCLLPLRKWRITFKGLLVPRKQDAEESDKEGVYVQLNFLWTPLTDVFDLKHHIPIGTVANYMASGSWFDISTNLNRYRTHFNGYEQGGYLMGTASIADEELELYLYGVRTRSRLHQPGKLLEPSPAVSHIFGNTQRGQMFHLMTLNASGRSPSFFYGHFITPSGFTDSIVSCSVDEELPSCTTLNSAKSLAFTTDMDAKFKAELENMETGGEWSCSLGWRGTATLQRFDLSLDGVKGCGIRIKGEPDRMISSTEDRNSLDIVLPTGKPPSPVPKVVTFQNSACKFSSISGGKGSSLAILTEIAQKVKTFNVPRGIVVTTTGYQKLMESSSLKDFDQLLSTIPGSDETVVKMICEKAVKAIQDCILPEAVCTSLRQHLKSVFGKDYGSLRFAVRSSACGEDSEEMSAAGQMDTFLGVQGFDQICKAVLKCWSSEFSYIAVSYKRRYGQPLNSPMAVVIQEMVPAEAAGVMFTCDPITGNPSQICITANYGLGESVVSAAAEPDTILLTRNMANSLKLASATPGRKKLKIVMDDSGGTREELVEDSNNCCLTEAQALKLGSIGVTLEKYYGAPRDIEWAITKEGVHLLQARPVTSLDQETEFEIIHELDTAFHSEKEYISTANVGEVLKGALSPLGISIMDNCLGTALKTLVPEENKREQNIFQSQYFPDGIPKSHCTYFINMKDMMGKFSPDPSDSSINDAIFISLFGRVIEDPEFLQSCAESVENPPKERLRNKLNVYKTCFLSDFNLKFLRTIYWNSQVKFRKNSSASDMYDTILKSRYAAHKASIVHCDGSLASSMFNNWAMSVLAEARGAMDERTYVDLAHLLSSCQNVVSADVPAALQKLSHAIARDIDKEKFRNFTQEEAHQWLRTTDKPCRKQFENFLKVHGHRCICEFDVYSVPWGKDPKPVIKNLQMMMQSSTANVSTPKKRQGVWESVNSLNLRMSFWTKLRLAMYANWCRQAVGLRENTKSFLVKMFDSQRKAVVQLANKMVSEGRLPDTDLMFYLTFEEIGLLLQTRDPRLVAKAHQRRRVYPSLRELRFPEIIKCPPVKPILPKLPDLLEGGKKMKGIPISKGVAKGPARVIHKLEEAVTIQKGDILITYSTDIGWSPYFPLLSGIVTELGGLMSHGAVVAREYGLPCLVGMQGASQLFKSGDTVLLDASNGILRELEEAEE